MSDIEGSLEPKPGKNYWEKLNSVSPLAIKRRIAEVLSKDPKMVNFKSWMEKEGPEVYDSYVQAIKNNYPPAMVTSFNDFCLYCFVLENHGSGLSHSEGSSEPPIQTTAHQKEIKEKFTDENIEKGVADFCDELGIYTEDELPPDQKPPGK